MLLSILGIIFLTGLFVWIYIIYRIKKEAQEKGKELENKLKL